MHYVDAKGDKIRNFQLLEVNNLAFIRRRFALPWSSWLLEGVSSRGFCTLVAQESRGRHRSHGIPGLKTMSACVGESLLESTCYGKLLFAFCTVFETPNRRPGGLVRVFDESSVGILVIIVVVVIVIFRLLCFGFGLRFQLCLGSFGELSLLWFRGFLWFI